MTRRTFRLLPDHISDDTIEALDALCEDAKKGKLIGLAYAAIYKRGVYIVDASGECARSPTFAIGMVEMLKSHLRDLERLAPP